MKMAQFGAALVLSGCYQSHELQEIDAGVDTAVDAPVDSAVDTGIDAPGTGTWWVLERRPAQLVVPSELGCTTVAGGTAAVHVTVPINNTCEHGGPATLSPVDGGYEVRAHVWVRHPVTEELGCLGTTAIAERDVTLLNAPQGRWEVTESLSGEVVELNVALTGGECGLVERGLDDPCTQDCQCIGDMRCIPALDDFVACVGGRCGIPCDHAPDTLYDPDLDCAIGQHCQSTGLATLMCVGRVEAGCPPPCADGLECISDTADFVQSCDWQPRLAEGEPCTYDSECREGRVCVEHATGDTRLCELPCFTQRQRCPQGHGCSPVRWICEFIGEFL